MKEEKHPGAGNGGQAYDKAWFVKKFGISETEVNMALAEIHYGSPKELEDYLKLKYKRS